MKLGAPIQLADGVYQLRSFGARVTVLTGDNGAVLVDAGARGSLGTITSGLRALNIELEQLRLIVLTHYHPDHSGGLGKLVEATGAKVAVHRSEAEIVSGGEPAPSPYANKVIREVVRPFMAPLFGAPVNVDYILEDGDALPMRDGIRVIHVPGHTRGSICLHIPAKKLLLVGDALQYRFGAVLSPPAAAVTEDSTQAVESLKKLLPLEFESIGFSHFPPLRRDARHALERLIRKATSG